MVTFHINQLAFGALTAFVVVVCATCALSIDCERRYLDRYILEQDCIRHEYTLEAHSAAAHYSRSVHTSTSSPAWMVRAHNLLQTMSNVRRREMQEMSNSSRSEAIQHLSKGGAHGTIFLVRICAVCRGCFKF